MADEVTRLRIGTVSAVDKAKLAARVIFKDENIVSGWLPVLQRTGEIVTVATAGKHDHDVDGDCTVKNTTKTPTTCSGLPWRTATLQPGEPTAM